MIQDDTRQTIKFVGWVIGLIIIAFLASIVIFYCAGAKSRGNDQKIAQLASNKTPITNIQKYYHLDRGTSSYAIKGTNRKGEGYYFIYLPNTKKAYLYSAKKGVSEDRIKNNFKSSHTDATINHINLGWYKGEAVWEVAYKKQNGNLGYTLYEFKNGNDISEVDNL
ncbi:hypothetical protein [Lactobacillus ultunensis]|uniref:DUF5590 domain-containing protein n=1 Tax=Lactobacillus ultunensis DSM 16047 TaxID=525365 RepID=C2EK45_9LACO|nr:hypothetical protein [Lactobacillus ultunensis]EEJ73060.1 hypothetical protein HMPREF0548_0041 [Lactobacillus ultunensis DSM 16047]QQP29421.1 hypothetical protein H4B44_05035 [Lactobacillus ultunensis]